MRVKFERKKRKVMETLRKVKKEDVQNHIVRGQYASGEIKRRASCSI